MDGKRIAGSLVFLALNAGVSASVMADDPTPDCSRPAGSLPRPGIAPGTPDPSIPVDHVIVLMTENHSFDNVLGKLNQPQFYGDEVDGIAPGQFNLDAGGNVIEPFHLTKECVKDMDHGWDVSHSDFN